MKLKFIVPSLAFLFAATAASAQISLGGQAGVVLAQSKTDFSQSIPGLSYDEKSRVGFKAGLIADIPFGESGLRLIPELNFVQRGAKATGKIDLLGQSLSAESNTRLSYIDLPVNVAYAFEAGNGRIIVGAGPYAALGIGGQTKTKVTAGGQTDESTDDVKFGSGEEELKPFDFGANFMAGYILNNGFLVKINYSLGFANLSNTSDTDFKNRYFGLTVGYFFLRGGE